MNYEEEDFTTKHVKGVFKRLFAYAFKFKKLLFSVVFTMVLMALIDVCIPLFTKYAIDTYVAGATTKGLPGFIVAMLVLDILSAFFVYYFISRTGRLETEISCRIRSEAFTHLQELSFSYYDTTAVGYIMARMISDVARLSEMVAWSIVDGMWALVYIVGVVVTMMLLHVKLALLVLSVVVPLSLAAYFFQRAILKNQRRVRKINSKITSAFNEGIMGAVTTKTLVREQANAQEFRELTTGMRRFTLKSVKLSALFMPVVLMLGSIGTALALYRGGQLVAVGVFGLGTLSAFISYSMQLFDPIQNITNILTEFQSAKASAERVFSLLDEPCEITDTPEVIEKYGTVFEPKTENWEPITGDIEFHDVSFKYNTGEQILEHFNLKVNAGENVAIVGDTGAGKSTLVNLVCRFYESTEGSITIDKHDYRERSILWLQKSLGYVLQVPHLFSGTIAENIAYANPKADMQSIVDAAKTVSAHDFIIKLENGYDTQVGEGGALLSTGQKQLISFARVVLADPQIFVLDEATSAVDTETEQLIQHAITSVLKNRTSFVIAHRLSTTRNADCIIVMEHGRIMEQGTHEQLIAQKGKYYNLYNLQLKTQLTGEILT